MGIKFNTLLVPPTRGGFMANHGLVDGEISRVYSYSENFPNLIPVEENTNYIVFMAYSCDKKIKLDGWKSLKDKQYKIEYRAGVKFIENKLNTFPKEENVSEARIIENAIRKLLAERIDIYIDIEQFFKDYSNFKNNKSLTDKIHAVGVIDKVSVHAQLHKKHRQLEPELSKTLKTMKEEGFFQKILDKYELDLEY